MPLLTALALSQTGILSAQQSEDNTLTQDPLYQEAIGALSDYLPAIASEKFNLLLKQKLKSKSLSKEQHLQLIFLLAESQVRANKPQDAIQSLSNKLIAENPDAIFWRGQALAASGRYNEAIETLEKASPKSKNYQLGQLKIAKLAITLGDIDKALNILKASVAKSKKVSTQTYLSLANLFLAKEEPVNAKETLDKAQPNAETELAYIAVKQLMLAQVDLLEKDYAAAISALQETLALENIRSKTENFAALQLADAYYAAGENQQAISTLIQYLDKQPGEFISPMFIRLGKWIARNTPITDPTIKQLSTWANLDSEQTADSLTKLSAAQIEIRAYAHYYYARFLANSTEPTSMTKAIAEFNNLRERYPSHILAGTSFSDSAATLLTLGRIDETKEVLKKIQTLTTTIAPLAKQQAGILLGKLNLEQENYAGAAKAYQTIIESTSGETKTIAMMNAAKSYLDAADLIGFSLLQDSTEDTSTLQNLQLEHALWLARNKQIDARINLHNFTLQHPNQPRINEARLSLALHCLNILPLDVELANLITPQIDINLLSDDQKVDLHYLKYRNAVTQKDFASAANMAQQFINRFPEHPSTPDFKLYLGQAYYHNGQHNDARKTLRKMAQTYPEHPLKHFAEFYAAMSAKLEGTPQSADEAISLLTEISKSPSPLAAEARLQLARLYTSTNKEKLAIDTLSPFYNKQTNGKKDLELSLTLATAYQALGSSEEKYFQSSIKIYDDLINQFTGNHQVVNEVKYNKALLLQQMGQDDLALSIYYSVIKIDPKKTPITEWNYYFKCGFRAITTLEEQKNPKAAMAIAKKLAESKGIHADEAAKKARDLEKKYMIWQE